MKRIVTIYTLGVKINGVAMDGRMLYVWGNGNVHKIYGWKTRREDPGVDKKIKLKRILL